MVNYILHFDEKQLIFIKNINTSKQIFRRNLEIYDKFLAFCKLYSLKHSEALFLIKNDISQEILCTNCKLKKPDFVSITIGYKKYCSTKCSNSSTEVKDKKVITSLKKFGTDNPSKNLSVINKIKEIKRKVDPTKLKETNTIRSKTMLNKYGYVNNFLIPNIKLKAVLSLKKDETIQKRINTNIEKYGSPSPSSNEEIKKKTRKSNLEKWGDEVVQRSEIYKKIKKEKHLKFLNIQHIDNSLNTKVLDIKNNKYFLYCSKCGKHSIICNSSYNVRKNNNIETCNKCEPLNKSSMVEKDLYKYVTELYQGEIEQNYKFKRKELDIFIPKMNLGIEFNGLWWHSEFVVEKNYHIKKKKFFKEQNIKIFNVWEDDWYYKQNIVKSMIKNLFNKSNKIYARKCEIKEVNELECKKFLNENHLFGWCVSKYKIGLYLDNILVSIMTLGKKRKSTGSIHVENEYELIRYCNKIDTAVTGGASKILKYFIKKYNPTKITSYANNDYSDGNLYDTLGFKHIKDTEPGYYWVVDKIKQNRFNYRKDILVKQGHDPNMTENEIMHSLGHWKIWNTGNKLYELVL